MVIKRVFKLILWPIKKILFFPIKFLIYSVLFVLGIILFFQYRADYEIDTSPLTKIEYENCVEAIESYDVSVTLLSDYVDNLDSYQREFLLNNLPDRFQVLLTPKTLDAEKFENIKGSLKTYLQGGRLPGFNGKALLPQAASLCRGGLG